MKEEVPISLSYVQKDRLLSNRPRFLLCCIMKLSVDYIHREQENDEVYNSIRTGRKRENLERPKGNKGEDEELCDDAMGKRLVFLRHVPL